MKTVKPKNFMTKLMMKAVLRILVKNLVVMERKLELPIRVDMTTATLKQFRIRKKGTMIPNILSIIVMQIMGNTARKNILKKEKPSVLIMESINIPFLVIKKPIEFSNIILIMFLSFLLFKKNHQKS